MNTPEEIIAVVQAHIGGKNIEFRIDLSPWKPVGHPCWDFSSCEYRIKPETKPKPEDYRQVKYKRKDQPFAVYSVAGFRSLEEFHRDFYVKKEDLDFCVFV